MVYIIGLTGGIATGKSTVSGYLKERSLPVLDADLYAREAVAIGSPILRTIIQRYGPDAQLPDGALNRPRLGAIIFNDPDEKRWVEAQIHPFVKQCFERDTAALKAPVIVYAIPLLFEAGLREQIDAIWVVVCTPEQQLRRLMMRNSLTLNEAQARIHSQMPLTEKAAQADLVLDNSRDFAALFHQIDRALEDIF